MIEIVKYILGTSVFSILFYYLMKEIIKRFFEAKVEKYKSDLNIELEKHKSELIRINQEHHIKFNHLHSERAQTLKNLYDELCLSEDVLLNLTTIFQGPGWQDDDKREEEAINRIRSLNRHIRSSRIYLPKELILELEELTKSSFDIISKMSEAKTLAKTEKTMASMGNYIAPGTEIRSTKTWLQVYQDVKENYRKRIEEIANEFKKLLGEEN